MGEGKRIQSYKDLIVYQRGYKLALAIYRVTKKYPKEELFGLISQMRRSAVSIPCNIAEGYRRKHRKEYIQFLHIASGSCGELETLIALSRDLNMVETDELDNLYYQQDEISRLLQALINSLSQPKRKKTGEGT
jgi:four helix bundle protein